MTKVEQTNNTLGSQAISLRNRTAETAIQNWNNHKVQVLGSGLASGLLAAGAGLTLFFGGPFIAILSLAATAFVALGLFLKSLLTQPQVTNKLPVIALPTQTKTKPIPAPIIEMAKLPASVETPHTQAEEQQISKRVNDLWTYASEHPYQVAVGAAIAAGAAYGLYAAYSTYAGLVGPLALPAGATLAALPAPKGFA